MAHLRNWRRLAAALHLAGAGLAANLAPAAAAIRPLDLIDRAPRLPSASAIHAPAPAIAPMGHVRLCMTNPAACAPTGGSGPARLDAARWAELRAVNASVNRAIAPRPEPPGRDLWEINVASGDCEEYALRKRQDLLALGWPPASLALAVVELRDGRHHLVLVARTDRGDFALDNLHPAVRPWTSAGYRWLKIQSAVQPQHWMAVSGAAAPPAPAPAVHRFAWAEGVNLRGTLFDAGERSFDGSR